MPEGQQSFDGFERRIAAVDPSALRATSISVLELNVGLRCNMACTHCHQTSSPERTEAMSDDVFDAALAVARGLRPRLVDLTGGAPELHPDIRRFIVALRGAGLDVQLRTNLTVLLEPATEGLIELCAEHGVRLLASLPSWDGALVARQRGPAAFAASIEALRRLNAVGFGMSQGLVLDLAANPDGAAEPRAQAELEAEFHRELEARHGVRFDHLLLLGNVPVGRFRDALAASAELGAYVNLMAAAFNRTTVPALACRRTLVVSWDGRLWDCDYNLGARLPLVDEPRSIFAFDPSLGTRRIAFGPHCFACTARSGTS